MDIFCSVAVTITLSNKQNGDITCFEFKNIHININTDQYLVGTEKTLVYIQFFTFLDYRILKMCRISRCCSQDLESISLRWFLYLFSFSGCIEVIIKFLLYRHPR